MNDNALTKTCSICGLQKPLAAFLQLSGPEGTSYGNICSTCRKTQRDQSEISPETEEGSASFSGLKIDTKTETKRRKDEKDTRTKTEEEYHEDRDKAEERQSRQIQKTDNIKKEQKIHRESFLDKPVDNKNKQATEPKNILVERAEAEQRTDLTAPVVDTQIAGKIKRTQSSTFNQFMQWLPGSSPLARAVKQATVRAGEHRAKTSKEEPEIPKDSPDYVNKVMGPKSRGR